jgi:4a-hydroxytetrahydrobiopterin dehydratase
VTTEITPAQFHAADGVEDWRMLGDGVCAYFRTGSFETRARLVAAIAELAGIENDHPDIDLRHDGVIVRLVLVSQERFGLFNTDVELARRISAVAASLGLTSDPPAVQTVQFTIDALAIPDVMPFWRAVLGYTGVPDSAEDLIDPRGRGPSIWFQEMDAPRPQRNRIHVDVWVPHDQVEARVAAAVAAGGRIVFDGAPTYWTLADAEGNEVDVTSWIGRD